MKDCYKLLIRMAPPRRMAEDANHQTLPQMTMENLVQLVAATIVQVMQSQQPQQQRQEPMNKGDAIPIYEKFRRLKPPSFEGTTDPLIAKGWIEELEKKFRIMACPYQQRVDCAIYMLTGEAAHWWKMADKIYRTEENPISWSKFKEIFYEKYFPTAIKDAREA